MSAPPRALDDLPASLAATLAAIRAVDPTVLAAAQARQDDLAKPRGALGGLEHLGVRLAAMAGGDRPGPLEPAAVALFAADHGVAASGVTPWPQEVTAQMVGAICAGRAASSVLARRCGARLVVVDVGVAGDLSPLGAHPLLWRRPVRAGTDDLSRGPAMTRSEACSAIQAGVEVADALVVEGARVLACGEMGIGNTTPAAALIGALCRRPAAEVTGRGTGVDDAMLAHKTAVVAAALDRLAVRSAQPGGATDAIDVLAELGGFEIGALAGFVLGAAARRTPVVVDGVITLAATVLAAALAPDVTDWVIAGHRSVEPGAGVALAELGLEAVLDLGMRLGEGSGALLALPVVASAGALLAEMGTLAEALAPADAVSDTPAAGGGRR
ncbi:MAG: nicotinate-nucleotide--dimethylbenzimidazole phosphoribosyltransferase [Acidimicrobiia bacterium]|nr:nicotinate-nucleotide--dimethylbenzimidazole phosphoribosyltransferase [Acidimicrobiia bacterium]